VPEEAIRRRFPRSLKNFFGIYVPISSSWRVYDGTGGPHRRLIAFGGGSRTIQILEPQTWVLIKEQA
jgi:predicted ABC-type ATPase